MVRMKMNIVVTGSNGFIGRSTVEIARKFGHWVTEFDYKSGLDILNPKHLENVITKDVHVVIHLAGLLGTSELLDDLDSAIAVNMTGTKNVLEATKEANAGFVGITMPDVWPSAYQATRIAGQRLAEAYNNAYGIPVTHIRAFNGYGVGQAHGPGHPQKIVPTFAYNSWTEIPIPIWGEGNQTVDLVHVDDIAMRLVLAANQIRSGDLGNREVFDAGTGKQTTVLEVANMVNKITKTRNIIEYLPMRKGELPNTYLAAKDFGPWTPNIVHNQHIDLGTNSAKLTDNYRLTEAVNFYKP